jgi:hypothetical protein
MIAYFKRWTFFRWVRLGMGVAIFIRAVSTGENLLYLAGALIIFMAFAHAGCGPGGCATNVMLPKNKVYHDDNANKN